jgi:D-alanyl-D-alanine carboxypeptidase
LNNRMSPRGLVAVMHALIDETRRQGLQPEDVLPVASCDAGTLRRRMEGTGFEGAVVGKTGTLTQQDGGMSNLGGLVYTKDEGVVLFIILAQGQRIWDNKQMADQLLAEVLHEHPAACVFQPNEARRQLLPQTDLQIGE